MLRDEEFGRLAYRLFDEVHITAITYAVDGGTLLFRTAEGNKLLPVAMGSEVPFEIDRHGAESARSVVVRGVLGWVPRTKRIALRTCRCVHGFRR